MTDQCRARRESDQMVCHQCGLIWDVNDPEPPECPKEIEPEGEEALDMIAHKVGRILNGDPDYADSWHDIAGYASLVDKRLKGEGS